MTENLNPANTDAELETTPKVSNLVKASQPMSDEQLQELASKLNRGWNAVHRSPKVSDEVPLKSPTTNPILSPHAQDELELADDLFAWIGETLDEHINKSARQHADAAVSEFLNVPCTNDDLLEFFRSFAVAYERKIRERIEVKHSALSSAIPTDRITIGMVSIKRELMATRLSRLTTLNELNPAEAEMFRLFEFAGCSVEELGRYFNLPKEEVKQQISDLWYDICESST